LASTATVLVFSMILSKRLAFCFSQTLTASRSGPCISAIHHFDDIDFGAQRRIDRGHFEADDAAADDQHLLRHEAQFERPGRIDDARVLRDEGQMHGSRTGGDDALLELDDLLGAGLVLPVPSVTSTSM
jgi:hypothetical protein